MLNENPVSRLAGEMSFKCELLFSACSLNKIPLLHLSNWLVIGKSDTNSDCLRLQEFNLPKDLHSKSQNKAMPPPS